MTYAQYYKILHRRNKYNVKFLADYLSMLFPLCAFEFDADTGIFSLDRSYLLELDHDGLNQLSKAISKHAYYDAFVDNKLLIIPHLWKK